MVRRLFLALILAALAFCAWVYVSNARRLGQGYPVSPVALAAAVDPEAARRGRQLANITGCTDCHGADLRGKLFIDEGWLHARIYSSNLTLKARAYSDADIARIVRTGVRPDGRGVTVMPSMGYVRMTDRDIADIIAFIRSVPAGGAEQPESWIGPMDHWALWRGRLKPAVAYVAAETAKAPPDGGPQHGAARALAGIVCAECHGGDLRGNGWDSGAPDLVVAKAYSLEDFRALLRTGVARGGRKLGLMAKVAVDRLHHLTDEQIAGLHAYLNASDRRPNGDASAATGRASDRGSP